MKKIIIEFVIIYTSLFFLFKYNVLIKNNIEYIFFDFIKNILPSMFPLIFITTYVKYNIVNKSNNKLIRFLSLSLSFAPSNALISKNKEELIYSTNINPLFSYIMMSRYLRIKVVFIIIIINLLINYILLFKKLDDNTKSDSNNKNISLIIKETTLNVINIFGVITFFNLIISVLSIFINNALLIPLEITNGYNLISNINTYNIKLLLSIFINSFCGIAIYFQMNSLNNDINLKLLINKIKLSIFITIITFIVCLLI